jgi:16S rRNA (cytosine1402-N4)-methyltransferase
MLEEVLGALMPKPSGRYIDGTLGGGGHAEAILDRSTPSGWLYGCDRDGDAIEAAKLRLARFQGRWEIRLQNFADLDPWVGAVSCDGALLDLGVSSYQLEQPGRGFSFLNDGPLDMRMDPRQSLTAAQVIAEASVPELAQMFWELGGERDSRRIAKAIDRVRQQERLETTQQLARLIERVKPRGSHRVHPATQVFQSLRIVVNDEVGSLRRGLEVIWSRLKTGARLAVITFHSLEDRMVKDFGQKHSRPYQVLGDVDVPELRQPCEPDLKWVSRKAICPQAEEIERNPRARSSQLRVFEKLYAA